MFRNPRQGFDFYNLSPGAISVTRSLSIKLASLKQNLEETTGFPGSCAVHQTMTLFISRWKKTKGDSWDFETAPPHSPSQRFHNDKKSSSSFKKIAIKWNIHFFLPVCEDAFFPTVHTPNLRIHQKSRPFQMCMINFMYLLLVWTPYNLK